MELKRVTLTKIDHVAVKVGDSEGFGKAHDVKNAVWMQMVAMKEMGLVSACDLCGWI